MAFVFGLQTLQSIDFSTKIYRLKDLEAKNNGHMNFYECCDLTKKVYLIYMYVELYILLVRFAGRRSRYRVLHSGLHR